MDPSSTDVMVKMNWVALSGLAAGNSPVIAYSLSWDNGIPSNNETSIVLTVGNVTNFTVNGVIGGTTYRFAVRAMNIYGYGDYSTATIVVPVDAPGKTDTPTVALSPLDAT